MIIITSKAPGVIDVQTIIDPKRRRLTGLRPAGGEGGIPVSQMPRIGDMAPEAVAQPVSTESHPISSGPPPEPPPEYPITAEAPSGEEPAP